MIKQFLISILLISFLSSCRFNTIERQLIGNWKVFEVQTDKKLDHNKIIIDARKEALSSSFEFKKDKSFTHLSLTYTNGIIGTWEIIERENDNILKLSISDSNYIDNAFGSFIVEFPNENLTLWTNTFEEYGVLIEKLKRE